jgi:tRNA(Ile)-lysidine synthase
MTNVLQAARDKLPSVRWAEVEIRRYSDDLYLMRRLPAHNAEDTYEWDLINELNLSHLGTLRAKPVQGSGLRRNHTSLQVRFRRGGEWLSLPGGSRSLKNLFQEWRVPPWLRNRIPLIFNQNELIAVVGYYLDERYTARQSETGYQIILET